MHQYSDLVDSIRKKEQSKQLSIFVFANGRYQKYQVTWGTSSEAIKFWKGQQIEGQKDGYHQE